MDIKLTGPGCRDPDPPNCKTPELSVDLFDSSPQRHLTKEQQFEYKYQLDIDGHGGTFRLKHLLISGSLVFKVDSPINQFWMPHLRPWIHYIPVSWHDFETDLIWKLRWAQGHDAEAKRIMLAGHRFVRDLLIDKTVTQYQQQVLMQLAELQTPPLPRLPNSVRFCCSLIPDDDKWAHWKQKCEQYENPSCTTSPAVDIFQLLS
ncbi:hypothetical protein D9Q98_004181 [Chlorella vulgaris]|uniref:Glycosyl transferase CAP10 domain-containing protein n=1 Tax=Chlorella vulgaris TaxID=3077 RepID=A0A9D4TRE0_CHLVU|nr:hypothetical protein D9Q98_004181 [Chlorella vulgaris]